MLNKVQTQFVKGVQQTVLELEDEGNASPHPLRKRLCMSPKSFVCFNQRFFQILFHTFLVFETNVSKKPGMYENGLENVFIVATVYYSRIVNHVEFEKDKSRYCFAACLYLAFRYLDDESDLHPIDWGNLLQMKLQDLYYFEKRVVVMMDWKLHVRVEEYKKWLLAIYNQGV